MSTNTPRSIKLETYRDKGTSDTDIRHHTTESVRTKQGCKYNTKQESRMDFGTADEGSWRKTGISLSTKNAFHLEIFLLTF